MVLITCYNCSEEKTNEGCVYGTLGLPADGNLPTTAGKWRSYDQPESHVAPPSEPGRESAFQPLPKRRLRLPFKCWGAKAHNVGQASKTCTAAEPDLTTSELCHFSPGTRDGAGGYGSPPRGGGARSKIKCFLLLSCNVLCLG